MVTSETRYQDVLELYTRKIKASKEITASNKATIEQYLKTGFQGTSKPTVSKNAQVIYALGTKVKKDFKAMKQKDLEPIMDNIINNERFTEWTKQKYVSCIMRFFRKIHGLRKGNYPPVVAWIEFKKPSKGNGIKASNLLTPSDIKRLISAARNNRDRFLISLLFDCGCRSISELETLNVGNCADKGEYLEVSFERSKTFPRILPVVNSLPYFREWLTEMKERKIAKPENPLFVEFGSRGKNSTAWKKRLTYESTRNIIKNCAGRTKLGKPCNLHWFRKSTASLYSNHFTNSILLDRWFGWSGKIRDTYVALGIKNLLAQYLEFYNSKENDLKILHCNSCKHDNPGYLDFCSKCNGKLVKKVVLTEEEEQKSKMHGLMEELFQDKDFLKKVSAHMQEKGMKV